ncbi:MAG: hypothetical protein ACK5L5_07090 [Bacteroidales bacterium]
MISKKFKLIFIGLMLLVVNIAHSQVTERIRPAKWDKLVEGARFIDHFLPMRGEEQSAGVWGADGVKSRYIDNGIEDHTWSYWGGNIKRGSDSLFHLLVCGWLESSAKGHHEWPNSLVFNAVSSKPAGPFKLQNIVGKGHNPEVFQINDGRYVLYVINGRYVTNDINGKWEYGKFDFNPRNRNIIEGLSNMSFAKREDGSFIMVCRGGGIWISKDGLSEYSQITDKSVYPAVDGEFEDPVIWKDNIQYHMIVNDWLGRIAYYLRSKDGVQWVVDPGEAYAQGISKHENGQVENWFKYERIKVFQDEYGRAIQANFAVIDTLKDEDKPFDRHSSKNITIPIKPSLLMSVLDEEPISDATTTIRVKIQAEDNFDPNNDINISTLRFGASEEVNYGRGCKAIKTEADGKDLIVTFDAKGSGITAEEFAPKLIGKNKNGRVFYAYARLPYVDYIEPMLSACEPHFEQNDGEWKCQIEIQNFGQEASEEALIKVEYKKDDKKIIVASGDVPVLQAYEKTTITLKTRVPEGVGTQRLLVTIYSGKKTLSLFEVKKDADAKK